MDSGFVRIEKSFENRVANLVIDRQEKMNSMTVAMRRELGQAFRDFSRDDDLRVIVVRGRRPSVLGVTWRGSSNRSRTNLSRGAKR